MKKHVSLHETLLNPVEICSLTGNICKIFQIQVNNSKDTPDTYLQNFLKIITSY